MEKFFFFLSLFISCYFMFTDLKAEENEEKTKVLEEEQHPSTQFGKNQAVVTLKEIGYTLPLIVRGNDPQLTLVIPHFPAVKEKSIHGRLRLHISRFVSQNSTITIALNGQPILEEKISKLGYDPYLTFPIDLDPQDVSSSFSLQISGNFYSEDNNPNNMWFLVDHATAFELTFDPKRFPLFSDYFQENINREIPIILACQDTKCVEAAIRMASGIGTYYYPWKFTAKLLPDSQKNTSGAKIYIGNYTQDNEQREGNLYLSPKGVSLILNKFYNVFTDLNPLQEIGIEEINETDPTLQIRNLSLESIGITSQTLRGSGNLSLAFPFRLSDLNYFPAHLDFTVMLSHSGTTANADSYLSLKLNGTIVDTQKLGNAEIKSYYFDIPIPMLKEQNVLEILASYYPKSNSQLNDAAFPPMEISILNRSAFHIKKGTNLSVATIDRYLGQFIGKGLVIVSDLSPVFYQTAAKLVEMMGRIQKKPILIDLATAKEKSEKNYQYRIAVVTPTELNAFKPILKIADNFVLMNPLTQQIVAKGNIKKPLGVMQMLQYPYQHPLLAVSDQNHPPFAWANTLSENVIENLRDNLAMYSQGSWYGLQVGGKIIPFYENYSYLNDVWKSIRLYVVSILALISGWFVLFIRKNLTKGGPADA